MTRSATQLRPQTSLGIEPGCSWLSLLASSSLGVRKLTQVEVLVSLGQAKVGAGPFRLVVQSYAGKNFRGSRPLGSVQRIVTAAELKRGVRLSLVELGVDATEEPYLVAWLEAGDSEFELDGRRAKPRQGSLIAMARATKGKNPVPLCFG